MSAHAEPLTGHGPVPAAHDGHGHDHGHDPHLAHHFEDMDQQQETHSLGMWTFLATEIMFFGGLFLAFTVYHVQFPVAFMAASSELNPIYGGINTFFLILSSLTMAMAVHAAQTGNRKRISQMLLFTILLAFCFCGVKSVEWIEKYNHHLIPGTRFDFFHSFTTPEQLAHKATILKADPFAAQHSQIFFLLYFIMTGLHGIHVVIGIGLLGWIWLRSLRNEFGKTWNTPVELIGLYWHLVDLIWIYLFPIIYLIHRNGAGH